MATAKTAVGKAAEKAVKAAKQPEMVKHIVTAEDLETNPDLVAQGVEIGDEIEIPKTDDGAKPKKSAKTEVGVFHGEELIRTYSAKDHGENFEELAKEFAAKNRYEVK